MMSVSIIRLLPFLFIMRSRCSMRKAASVASSAVCRTRHHGAGRKVRASPSAGCEGRGRFIMR